MPSSKKKRKPASNSARGFSTTSTPSKSKIDEGKSDDDVESGVELHTAVPTKHVSVRSSEPISSDKVHKETHGLVLEESDFDLEESNLQQLLEDYGEKVKRDATRQSNRVVTEQRVLRTQSERLDIGSWLPDKLIQEIFDLLIVQKSNVNSGNESFKDTIDSQIEESNQILRLWTLEKILGQLGFKEDLIRLVLHSLLKREPPSKFTVNKDAIWGLDECFDILTLMSGSEEISHYGSHVINVRPKTIKVMQHDEKNEEYGQRYCSSFWLSLLVS